MEDPNPDATLTVNRFETSGGAHVFQIPVEQFPGFWGYVYLALAGGWQDNRGGEAFRVLIDTGSGFGDSNQHLESGLQTASELAGQPLGLAYLTHVFITHGHIDHFGGLGHVRPRTEALVGVHELDRRILTNYEERLAVVARRMEEFLVEAGVSPERRQHLTEMYKVTKSLYSSTRVDFTYEAEGMQVGPFEFLHVPGHCAGHVVIRLHDVLFSGDHVLKRTSPHQSPERLTLSTGLDHYLRSLEVLRPWAAGVHLTFGGHEDPITDLPARLDELHQMHRQRLDRVLELLAEPDTIAGVSRALFGEVSGYHVLLALEEAGAHVEYLYQRGLLGIANLADLEAGGPSSPIRYQRLPEG